MIESWLFVFTMLVVLLIPGPSNAFFASFAHQHGLAKSILLIPIQLLGYLYAINLWSLVVHLTLPVWPYLIHLLHVVSVAYIGWLAFRLWKKTDLQKYSQQQAIWRPKHVFWATLKNPKSLLFAVGIFPLQTWDSPTQFISVFAIFSIVLIPTALFWMLVGHRLFIRPAPTQQADLLYKGSAVVLMVCLVPVLFQYFD
jgi:threonine/homoserine/homoserine lactone efflux protein